MTKVSLASFAGLFFVSSTVFAATPQFSAPVKLGSGVNTPDAVEAGGHISADGLTLHFHSNRNNGGPAGDFNLFKSTRVNTTDAWGAAVEVTELNSGANDRGFAETGDGLTVFFVSDRDGTNDIWSATRSTTADMWSAPTKVSALSTGAFTEGGVDITPDGLLAAFHSDRGGGGVLDLYLASRPDTSSPFSMPAKIGNMVNDPAFVDVSPSLSSNGLEMYFHSARNGPDHDFDLFYTSRPDLLSGWATPMLLAGLNSDAHDLGASISPDGKTIFFASDRDPSTVRDIYMATVVPIPAAIWLFGSGLLGLTALARRSNGHL